jgi:hypothetical protein
MIRSDINDEYAFNMPTATDTLDVMLSGLICSVIVILYVVFDTSLLHWFLIPVFLCGMIVGIDAVKWLRNKYDIFDPMGMVGVFGISFFLIDPLAAASFNVEMPDAPTPPDYRFWIGKFFVWQVLGLLLYQFVQHMAFQRPSKASKTYWSMNTNRVLLILPLVICIAFISHMFFMFQMGGIGGFLARATYGTVAEGTVGLGPLMVFGRSLPILILIMLTVLRYHKMDRNKSLSSVGLITMCMALIILFFYGLDTSRSTLVWGMVWVMGILHLFWRQIKIKWIVFAMIPFMGFMYIYGFYKNVGTRVFEVFTGQTSLKSLEEETGRTLQALLIGDLGRSQTQASMLYCLQGMDQEYRYRLGTTYITSIVPLIPRKIWPSKPTDSGKVIAATELFMGENSYRGPNDVNRSTRVFALPGEAMLNYGVLGIPVSFAVFGYIMARIRRRMLSYHPKDMRLLSAPFLSILLLLILTHDSSNVAMQALFNWAIPAGVIFLCSRKVSVTELSCDTWETDQSDMSHY